MSMDARIMATLPSHPKTRKLIKRHGQASAWNLICLFLFACANKSDGVLSGMTAEDIELACDWQGDDGAFILALVEIGFLDHDGQAYSIHDWATHNPWVASAKARSESAKQNASKRWAKSGNSNAELMQSDAVGINPHCGSHDSALRLVETGNAPSPSPSPSPSPLPTPPPSPNPNQKHTPPANAADPCPHAEIISAYHELLPTMPAVREWTDTRKSLLRSRWREKAERQSVDWWRGFFADVSKSDFLCGRTDKPFTCSLEWMLKPTNFTKIIEGFYIGRQGQAQAKPVDSWAGRDI